MSFVPSLETAVLISVVSIIISLNVLLVSYLQYKSPNQVRASRERIIRERFENSPTEYDLRPARKLEFSPPRIRKWGFRKWILSLKPGADYPLYSEFRVRFKYPNYPSLVELASAEEPRLMNYVEPPEPEQLESNKKLQTLGVIGVKQVRSPQYINDGEIKVDPTVDYTVFIDSSEPDEIGNVIEMFRSIVEEIQLDPDDELVEYHGEINSPEDINDL